MIYNQRHQTISNSKRGETQRTTTVKNTFLMLCITLMMLISISAASAIAPPTQTISFLQEDSFVGVDDTTGFSTDDSTNNLGKSHLDILSSDGDVNAYQNGNAGTFTHRGTRGLGVQGGEYDEVDSIDHLERIEITFDKPYYLTYIEVRSLFIEGNNVEQGDIDLYLGDDLVGYEDMVATQSSGNGVWNKTYNDPILVDKIKFYVDENESYYSYSDFAVARLSIKEAECYDDNDCDNGLYCDGEETCVNYECVNSTPITCDNPPEPEQCYNPGYCDEDKDKCRYPKRDDTGPTTSNVVVDPAYSNGHFNITATAEDECSVIEESEYFLGHSGVDDCGTPGTGTPMSAEDGSFDELIEDLIEEDASIGNDGQNWVCVQSKDEEDKWGNCACTYFETDTVPPERVYDIYLNGVKNPKELLVCGDDPELNVTICDSQSDIQGGEYFLDKWIPPEEIPAPGSGYWLEPYAQFYDDGWHCANLSDIIELDNLSDGTHYINQIRGKDIVENWGKVWNQNLNYSFIIDRTPPETYKELIPFEGEQVDCYGSEESEANVTAKGALTNGCYYVKQGTQIVLTAQDPDPQQTGEFADNVIIYYKVWWKQNATDEWVLDQEGQSEVNGSVTINLTKDSYHLIEYWSVDLCGEEEEHHFELDIVDTQAPEMWKEVGEPSVLVNPECDPLTEVCNYYITQNTDITFRCEDLQPHPVDNVTMHIDVYWKETEAEAWPTEPTHSFNPDSGEWTFNCHKDSMHKFVYYCEDALGNKGQTYEEIDYVDTQAPDSHKVLGTPVYEADNYFGTPSYDPQKDKGYFIWEDETGWHIRWTGCTRHYNGIIRTESGVIANAYEFEMGTTSGPDSFTLDPTGKMITFDGYVKGSDHEDGIDFTFNGSFLSFELYLDGELIDLNKIFVGPNKVNPLSMPFSIPFTWITQNTTIDMYCNDLGPHPVGGEEIYYRVWYKELLGNEWDIPEGFELYDGTPFTFDKDSYHLIEFFCEDELNNTEVHRYEVDYVDTYAPDTNKIVGEPKELAGGDFEWWVTQNTLITLECNDNEEHPSGIKEFKYRINGGEWVDYVGPFSFADDCNHTLEWYCEDNLGNSNGIQLEKDKVDTEGPEIVKWVDDDTVKPGDTVRICANVTDYKQTGDAGVGVDWVKAHLVLGDDLYQVDLVNVGGNTYCGDWTVPPIKECHYCHCGFYCLWDLWVDSEDLLGNYNEEDGIEIIVDNAKPKIKYVLNPQSGRYYRDGKPFSVYAPAIDFGGDTKIYNSDNCKASGVKECRFYAFDYPFEEVSQEEVKNYWDWLEELDYVWNNPYVVFLGSVPYEDGVCKGVITIPENSNLTDKVFFAYEIEDNSGNVRGGMAKDANDDLIIMDIDNDGPEVLISELGNTPGPLTSGDNIQGLRAEITDPDSGFVACHANLFKGGNDTGVIIDGHNLGHDVCEINGIIPDGLESGNDYELRVYVVDSVGNVGYDWADLYIDNTRPDMSIISPAEEGVYSDTIPVSLLVTDTQSVIADETVMVKIAGKGHMFLGICIGGSCQETEWILLEPQHDNMYSKIIDLAAEGIDTEGEYMFDAVACDALYVSDPSDLTGKGFDMQEDRNSRHCRQISLHGANFIVRPECNDGWDNDGDEYIDYVADSGCENPEDDSEDSDYCGDGNVDAGEYCDDGENNGLYGYCNADCTGDGPSCGDEIINGPEECEFDSDCISLYGEGYHCEACVCTYNEEE